ncbi:TIGR01244 family sulfur transferase [Shimia thalassica]|uniref:TIGR01244 family sulfur transferase n=1 Tax=Shimia thalassica TaxID=1715693 RepID=UPI0026E23909|nr:TIGR01244 family sulfur transferase [Shimia thalassica]MDO6800679.1 TIGR01244 family sulfur transferase [Shimia thalassica]
MELRQITPRYFVSPQIAAEDVPALKEAGFTLVICNRPDAEIPPSHHAAAIGTAVTAAGIDFFELPLTHDTMTPENLAAQRAALEASEGKVLAYCASGTRSTIAWSLGHANSLPVDDILNAARQGGYELEQLRPRLEMIATTA